MKVLGILIMIAGILLGIYLGVWVLFIGGIAQIVEGLNPVNAIEIVIGIARVIFCELGAIPAWLGILVGGAMIEMED